MVFALLLCLSLGGAIGVRKMLPPGEMVVIEVQGKRVYELPLNKDTEVDVQGPLGSTHVIIKGGRVRVLDSPCPEKICVKEGWKDRGAIVCLPNRVVVRVTGKEEHGVDAITR